MSFVTTKDGTRSSTRTGAQGQPIVFHHGWPLSADDWDNQMLFFLAARLPRHRPRPPRPRPLDARPTTGNEMDTYAADVAALAAALDLRDAIHVGHSTGGGEVARYVARARQGPRRQGRADRRGAADHGQVRQATPAACRSRCSTASARRSPPTARSSTSTSPSGPFYGFNRPGAKVVARP